MRRSDYIGGGLGAILLSTGGVLAAAFNAVAWPVWACALIGFGAGAIGGVGVSKLAAYCCWGGNHTILEDDSESDDDAPVASSVKILNRFNNESQPPWPAFNKVWQSLYTSNLFIHNESDRLILKRGLCYRLSKLADSQEIVSVTQQLNAALTIENPTDRYERLCEICGVLVCKLNIGEWNDVLSQMKCKNESAFNQKCYYSANQADAKTHTHYSASAHQEEQPKFKAAKPLSEAERFILIEHKNPYKILGINEHASKEDIKAAFRRKMLECHPDKSAAKDANERTADVVAANSLLANARGTVRRLLAGDGEGDGQKMMRN